MLEELAVLGKLADTHSKAMGYMCMVSLVWEFPWDMGLEATLNINMEGMYMIGSMWETRLDMELEAMADMNMEPMVGKMMVESWGGTPLRG